MGFDSWGVMPGLEENEFVLAFRDSSLPQGKPFMRTSDPMSEEWIRCELKEAGISPDLIENAIARAKKHWKKDNR